MHHKMNFDDRCSTKRVDDFGHAPARLVSSNFSSRHVANPSEVITLSPVITKLTGMFAMRCASRMSRLFCSALFLVIGTACNKMPSPFTVKDRSPRSEPDTPFDPPNTYPEWAYDAPQYVRPPQELVPEPKVNSSDPLHYFTNQKVVLVRRPEGYTPEEIPRVAVWWTDNNGFHWNKAGFFGRQQAFFPLEVDEDGDYGIRFVGPGQDPALHSLPYPERVYHVDTVLPDVEVAVEPEKTWYHVGETVTISWRASDYHLIEYPVRIGMLYDFTAQNDPAVELQRDLADEGTISYTLPPETLDHEVRFRVDALDRAGNLGIAISFALQVVPVETHHEGDPFVETDQFSSAASSTQKPAAIDDLSPVPIDRRTGETAPAPSTPSVLTDADFYQAEELSPVPPRSIGSAAPLPMATVAARSANPEAGLQWSADATGANLGSPALPLGTSTQNRTTAMTPVDGTGSRLTPPDIATGGEASPDGDGPLPSRETRIYEGFHPATPDAAPAVEVTSGDQLRATATPLDAHMLAAIGVTHADSLLVPMPATVQPSPNFKDVVLAHPWRTLHGVIPLALDTIWTLPRPRFHSDDLNRLLDGGYLAGGDFPYPVSEPSAIGRTVVSVPEAVLGTEVNVRP